MASTRKSPRGDPARSVTAVDAAVGAALAEHVSAGARVALALSGGVDSMVLLDALTRRVATHPLLLSAIHVHHGLSPNADRWAHFCAEQCALRNIPLTVHRLRLERGPGQSIEAVARAARYACLMAAAADVVALAHHADDQAETLLLQLLRGAGPQGLAAMPRHRAGRPSLLRPLLGLARTTLAACATARALAWVDDESNADRRHARNFLRHEIAPLLAAHFPGYPGTLVRAARHQTEAAELADALGVVDAAGVVDATGLDRARLGALAPARARNLLRWFLREHGLRPPSEARLGEMIKQLVGAGDDAQIRIAQDSAEIGRHRGRIAVHAPAAMPYERIWEGETEVRLPGGTLVFERSCGAGLAAAKLERVTLRSRGGGERIRLAANRPTHTVKKLLQDARMPPWERTSLPLIWSGNELAAVPGIGIAFAFQAAADEEGWTVDWQPESPTRGRILAD